MTRGFPILARLAVTLAVAATTAPVHAQQSSLELRGGAAPPPGSIVRCTAEGVVLVSSLTGEITIGWDRVRSVSGEHAEAASEFMDVADKAWRATSRLGVVLRAARKATGVAMMTPSIVPSVAMLSVSHRGQSSFSI